MENRIQLACMSALWGFLPLPSEQVPVWLDDVQSAGFDGIATFDRDLLAAMAKADLESKLRDRNLQLASVDFIIIEDFDFLKTVCTAMQQLGGKYLVAIGGLAKPGADMNKVADLLNKIGDQTLCYDIRTCFHNHTNTIAETFQEYEQLLQLTDPDKVAGFLDVGHATKDFVDYPVATRAQFFLEKHWRRIEFMEFKDWSEKHDLCTEVGAGVCDWDGIFTQLKKGAYSGWITVEQNGPMGDRPIRDSAAASSHFIRKGLSL